MPERHRRRRLPFTLALVGVITLLLVVMGATMAGLSYRHTLHTAESLMRAAMDQASGLAADRALAFLREAEASAALGPRLAADGLLDVRDDTVLSRYALAVLGTRPALTWVSYGGRDERFVGAWRDEQGAVFLNRSWPQDKRIRLREERVTDQGRQLVRSSGDHGYFPSQRPYFRLAVAARKLVWTEPYGFYGQGLGITCAAPTADLGGVFTVDLSFDALSAFLRKLRISEHGRAFLIDGKGTLLAGPHAADARPTDRREDVALVSQAAVLYAKTGQVELRLDRPDGVQLVRLAPVRVGDLRWLVAVAVPEADYLDRLAAQTRQTLALGIGALVLAVLCGVAMARWMAKPLRDLTAKAQRIRGGDLDVAFVAESRDEIGTLTETMAEMVVGLRDRDFIRDTLGRYVSPEVAAQCLHDRESLRLGGELRTVTLLMSDLRGFSGLSERLGPDAMLRLLNRYFAVMTPIILAHGGTINEFIGDAILVLFGAPFERPGDAERTVRCAAAMQRAMVAFNAESASLAQPELAMGIGIHTGEVVAGNIGSHEHVKYGVVGPAVNLTSRIEAQTLGAQVLVSAATVAAIGPVASLGPPRHVALKGAQATTTIHELLGVDGELLPVQGHGALVVVDLAATLQRIEDVRVDEVALAVRVRQLGLHAVELALVHVDGATAPRQPVADLQPGQAILLRVEFAGGPGVGSYAKVSQSSEGRLWAAFTSLAPADRAAIEALLVPAS